MIELPPPQPVEVTEYQVIKRWCPHYQRWHSPRLDLSQTVLGRGRIGVRIAALIAYLRPELRMTIRQIQAYGYTVQELWLSIGEITALLHRVQQAGQTAFESLKEQMRRAEVVHADETGWRQDGQKEYVWVFVTPGADSIRYYEHESSHAQHVVKRILGSVTGRERKPCLVTDFDGACNDDAGPQQRCWVHLLGDLHELKEEQGQEEAVLTWVRGVWRLYDDAQGWLHVHPDADQRERGVRQLYDDAQGWLHVHPDADQRERGALHEGLVKRAVALGSAMPRRSTIRALAPRLLRDQDELFQVVVCAGVKAGNNEAERAVRSVVVMRKISGGTRSERGRGHAWGWPACSGPGVCAG